MINFRFHLASLIAIFLALALGVVIGAGVIDRGVVDALDSRLDRVSERADRIEGENEGLRAEIGELNQENAALAPHALDDRLANADVGMIAVRGADDDRVGQTVEVLQQGGARVTGVLWIESPWNLEDEEQVSAMAEALGSPLRRPAALRAEAWQEMAERMSDPLLPDEPVPDGADDVLVRLQDAGFLGFDGVEDDIGIEQFPGIAPALVLVVGSDAEVPAEDVVMDAARSVTAVEMELVVADVYDATAVDAGERGDDLDELRDSDLSQTVSTVNDLDRPIGPVTVALAVADILRIPPVVGHYGIGAGVLRVPESATS
jgi:hypothetical protein